MPQFDVLAMIRPRSGFRRRLTADRPFSLSDPAGDGAAPSGGEPPGHGAEAAAGGDLSGDEEPAGIVVI